MNTGDTIYLKLPLSSGAVVKYEITEVDTNYFKPVDQHEGRDFTGYKIKPVNGLISLWCTGEYISEYSATQEEYDMWQKKYVSTSNEDASEEILLEDIKDTEEDFHVYLTLFGNKVTVKFNSIEELRQWEKDNAELLKYKTGEKS